MSPISLVPLPERDEFPRARDTPHGERGERFGALAIALLAIALGLVLSLRF